MIWTFLLMVLCYIISALFLFYGYRIYDRESLQKKLRATSLYQLYEVRKNSSAIRSYSTIKEFSKSNEVSIRIKKMLAIGFAFQILGTFVLVLLLFFIAWGIYNQT